MFIPADLSQVLEVITIMHQNGTGLHCASVITHMKHWTLLVLDGDKEPFTVRSSNCSNLFHAMSA